jgi:hypothetical protein
MILKKSGLAAAAFHLLMEINVFLNYLLIPGSGKVCLRRIRAAEWLSNHHSQMKCAMYHSDDSSCVPAKVLDVYFTLFAADIVKWSGRIPDSWLDHQEQTHSALNLDS